MLIKPDMPYRGICVTDLDGTLLDLEHNISKANMEALYELGDRGICRVAATGRSLYSMQRVITPDMPFDFIIFTTGAGIINWENQHIIFTRHIENPFLSSVFLQLWKKGLDFMMHSPIPENHHFLYVRGKGLPDFYRRIKFYQAFAVEWDGKNHLPWEKSAQFLVITDQTDTGLYETLTRELAPLKVVHATSPIDHASIWLEIFHPDVSKGMGVQFLAELFSLDNEQIIIVGNDYNDADMLNLTRHSYVTANAPEDLKAMYSVVADHTASGFAEAVSHWLRTEE